MKEYLASIEDRMEKTINVFKNDLVSIRAGRAQPGLLDKITVEYYGVPTPLAQVGNISCPDARSIIIQPWDKRDRKSVV